MKYKNKDLSFLVTGNLGYVGPGVVKDLRILYPNAKIIGFDMGLFLNCFTENLQPYDTFVNQQYYGDIRNFPTNILEGIDVVVHLAAISNDPIGNEFSSVTNDINYRATVELAKNAKEFGIKTFIFASSCSVYGAGNDKLRSENDPVDPLTAYAKSKVRVEEYLDKLSSNNFLVTTFRFATACGWSQRFRFDLVLNDFVAAAYINSEIEILSDGKPWRPLIDVSNMAKAISWAAFRPYSNTNHLLINCGSNEWNFSIADLANKIANFKKEVKVKFANSVAPDKRSYAVDFSKFKTIAPSAYPSSSLEKTVSRIWEGVKNIDGFDKKYRNSKFVRLSQLRHLRSKGYLDAELKWKQEF